MIFGADFYGVTLTISARLYHVQVDNNCTIDVCACAIVNANTLYLPLPVFRVPNTFTSFDRVDGVVEYCSLQGTRKFVDFPENLEGDYSTPVFNRLVRYLCVKGARVGFGITCS